VIFSHVLYQLSYLGAGRFALIENPPAPVQSAKMGPDASSGDEAIAVDPGPIQA
jgi:hypothetical protein